MRQGTEGRFGTVRRGVVSRLTVVLLGCLLVASWVCGQERAVGEHGKLSVQGNRIVDAVYLWTTPLKRENNDD